MTASRLRASSCNSDPRDTPRAVGPSGPAPRAASRVSSPNGGPLTPRQTRFVAEYLIDCNATQAAVRAGYSAKTAYSIGGRLLKNVDVAHGIANGQAQVAVRHEFTLDEHMRTLERLRNVAEANGQLSAAIHAESLRGKAAGFYRPQFTFVGDLDSLPDAELQALADGRVPRTMCRL